MPIRTSLWLLLLCTSVRADDWPTYQHDERRSGVTRSEITLPLHPQWRVKSAAPPKPAWPLPQEGWTELPRVDFDDVFYPIADADTVYFGSSVDHQVHALDAATGKTKWRHFTGGPVRLAPTLDGDRIYFGSDDGTVTCLKKADGSVIWSRDLAPSPRKVIGNGQIISLWPVRTGLLVKDGLLFCSHGVFPYHKVALFALDAFTGETAWRKDDAVVFGGFSPQGYILTNEKDVIVPSGRATAIGVNQRSGEVSFNVTGKVTERGGTAGVYGTLLDGLLYVGTQNNLFGINTQTGNVAAKWANADRMLGTADRLFLLKGPPPGAYGRKSPSTAQNDITCIDRTAWAQQPKKDLEALKKAKRWRLPRPGIASMILAGKHLTAGGEGEVVVVDSESGKVQFEAKVEGDALGLAVAQGRLFVSTTAGCLYCFASQPAPAIAKEMAPLHTANPLAQALLKEAGVTEGFALVVGEGSVEFASALARHSDLKLTAVVTDPAKRDAARRAAPTDLYGHRVTVDALAKDQIPFPDYGGHLVVVMPGTELTARELMRVVKPCGGVLIHLHEKLSEENLKTLQSLGDVKPGLKIGDRTATKVTRGDLPGSGWWTHQFADAGGSGSSGDKRIQGALDVLWFGEPGADEFPDRHQRGAAPLLMHGRVFCAGWNFLEKKTTVFCFDAYTGQRYWKREVEGAIRLGLPAVPGNLACDDDTVFVAGGKECHRLDTRTGKTLHVFETPKLPDGQQFDWNYLAVSQGKVVGSIAIEARAKFSDLVFAYDLKTNKLLWQARAKEIRDTTLSLGKGRVFYAENRKDAPAQGVKLLDPKSRGPQLRSVVALDLDTGKIVWEKEVDITDCGRWDQGAFGVLQMLCNDDVLVLGGAYTIYYNPNAKDEPPHKAVALSTKDGRLLWSSVIANKSRPVLMSGALLGEPLFYDLQTGAKIMKKQGTKMVPWSMGPRTGGCGSLSASESMVFGRGGYTVWRDVVEGKGSALVGARPGCFINIIPAGGVVVQAEASSGCTCFQAIQCTIVMRPRRDP